MTDYGSWVDGGGNEQSSSGNERSSSGFVAGLSHIVSLVSVSLCLCVPE